MIYRARRLQIQNNKLVRSLQRTLSITNYCCHPLKDNEVIMIRTITRYPTVKTVYTSNGLAGVLPLSPLTMQAANENVYSADIYLYIHIIIKDLLHVVFHQMFSLARSRTCTALHSCYKFLLELQPWIFMLYWLIQSEQLIAWASSVGNITLELEGARVYRTVSVIFRIQHLHPRGSVIGQLCRGEK